jgi:hypothetical protein
VEVDTNVYEWHHLAYKAVGYSASQRAPRVARKGAVHILAIGYLAAKIQKAIDIEYRNGHNATPDGLQ